MRCFVMITRTHVLYHYRNIYHGCMHEQQISSVYTLELVFEYGITIGNVKLSWEWAVSQGGKSRLRFDKDGHNYLAYTKNDSPQTSVIV